MVAQPVTMIRQQHDERIVVEPAPFDRCDELADNFVGSRDLAVVRWVLLEPDRGRVRSVWLVDVKEEEESRGMQGIEATGGDGQRRGAIPLQFPDGNLRRGRRPPGAELIEPFSGSRPVPQYIRLNKGN